MSSRDVIGHIGKGDTNRCAAFKRRILDLFLHDRAIVLATARRCNEVGILEPNLLPNQMDDEILLVG